MQTQNKSKKKLFIIALLVIFFLLGGIFIIQSRSKVEETVPQKKQPEETGIMPTVDSSTQVKFAAIHDGKEAMLNIVGIPAGTESMEYELSYQEKQKGLQGIIGTIQVKENEKNYEKKITIGTCSSGRCVYHEVVGRVKVTLKFTGSYGDKLFEKEYDI